MLTGKERAELQLQTVLDRMQEATGLSVEELQLADKAKAKAADDRRRSLGLPFPCPTSPDIKRIQAGISSCAYKGKRSIPGKGIGQNAIVLYNIWTSAAIESDDRLWFHASITRNDGKMPTYEDLCWLKENFFADTWAMQYFPPKDQHISHHHKCLHLWTCMECDLMPDFRKLGTI